MQEVVGFGHVCKSDAGALAQLVAIAAHVRVANEHTGQTHSPAPNHQLRGKRRERSSAASTRREERGGGRKRGKKRGMEGREREGR